MLERRMTGGVAFAQNGQMNRGGELSLASQNQGPARNTGSAGHSGDLERDARLVNADDHKVAPGEIAIGVVIGRMSEFFDFSVYAIASVLVFPRIFFPNIDPNSAMLYSFAIFALAFIARPIGS